MGKVCFCKGLMFWGDRKKLLVRISNNMGKEKQTNKEGFGFVLALTNSGKKVLRQSFPTVAFKSIEKISKLRLNFNESSN